jgi:hypothetical protein
VTRYQGRGSGLIGADAKTLVKKSASHSSPREAHAFVAFIANQKHTRARKPVLTGCSAKLLIYEYAIADRLPDSGLLRFARNDSSDSGLGFTKKAAGNTRGLFI